MNDRTRLLLPVATALLLHLAIGVRPFPSIDDLAYGPVFRMATEPVVYARDVMVAGLPSHALIWSLLFRLGEATGALATTMYAATFLLAIATTVATFRLMRALGATGTLYPLFAIVAFAGTLKGFGRGTYDGAFGAGVHGQWMALVALLFAYDALCRQRHLRAGVWLGLSVLGHVAVALHGVVVVSCAILFGLSGVRRQAAALVRVALVCALVGAPVLIPVLTGLLYPDPALAAAAHVTSAPTASLDPVHDLWVRRLVHEFSWNVELGRRLIFLLYGLAGVVGLRLLSGGAEAPPYESGGGAEAPPYEPGGVAEAPPCKPVSSRAVRTMAGLIAGQALLACAAVAFYGPFGERWALPYSLSLTRTTPLLIVLLSCVAVTALEQIIRQRERPPGLAVVLAASLTVLLLAGVRWTLPLVVLLVIGAWSTAAALPAASAIARWAAAGFAAAAAAIAFVIAVTTEARTLDVPAGDAELYQFARGVSRADAVFVVPPGLDTFRFFARRGAYVDWRLFPTPAPPLLPVWLSRLEEVAAPDTAALQGRGWPAVPLWDSAYAKHNTPVRIARLLASTGADYFVSEHMVPASEVGLGSRSSPGAAVPAASQASPESAVEAGLAVVFRNARFTVYQLASHRADVPKDGALDVR